MPLAKKIVVDRDEQGVPRITIDGQVLPWFTDGIETPAPDLKQMPSLTITIPAEQVEMVNWSHPLRSHGAKAGPPYRCEHPGCMGCHVLSNEACC